MSTTFNIVHPIRDDFVARAVSAAVELDVDRIELAAKLRAIIEERGSINPMPEATKVHTAEELAEMGYVSLTLYNYAEQRSER